MKAFATHLSFEFRSGIRNPSQLLMNYLFPVGVYFVLGLIMTQVNPLFADTMVPAMVLLAGMATFLLGFPGPLVEARQAGVFRSYKISGVPAASILFVPVISTMLHFLVASAVIVASATPLFGGAPPRNWGAFAAVTLLTALCYGSFGALIAVASSNSRVVMMLSQLIFLPSMLLGGLMVPLSMLPAALRGVAFVLPTTHLMQAYLGLSYGADTVAPPMASVAVVLAASALALVVAVTGYSWDARNQGSRRRLLGALVACVPFIVSAVLLR